MKYFLLWLTFSFCLISYGQDDEPKEESQVDFVVLENVPIYPGCKGNNLALKNCMSKKISESVAKNFKTKVTKKLDLPDGVVTIYVQFKINQSGEIKDIRARAPHIKLEEEAIRVIKKLPKMKKPGYQRGKPVTVPYALPIKFVVESSKKR